MKKKTLIANVVKPWQVNNGKLIAPVTLIKQGVLCGSGGCVLWKNDIIKASVNKWEGVPVVLNHPMVNGQFVSANETPHEIIGRVTKPHFDSFHNCLRGYVEIDVNRQKVAQVQDLKEVSIGVFSDTDYESGTYYNKSYSYVAKEMHPDHLALLKGQIGACSWEDGCGIRINSKESTMEMFIDNMAKYIANQINSNNNNLNSKIMNEEVLMPLDCRCKGKIKEENLIDVNAWDESEILPPGDVAAMLSNAKKSKPGSEDQDNDILLPIF